MLRVVLVAVLIVLLARAFWRVVDGFLEGLSTPPRRRVPERGVQMARDPVCGTYVVPERAVTIAAGPRVVFFCSTACRDKFRAQMGRGASVEGRSA